MKKVSDFVEEELKSYEENKQEYIVCMFENGVEVANAYIQDFKEELPQYMEKEIKKIEYYSESAYVHI